MLWCDAVGLALFSVTGAEVALLQGAGHAIANAMGVTTATFGGVIRDILGGEITIILRREIHVPAALLGAAAFVFGQHLGLAKDISLVAGFVAELALRSAATAFDLSLPVFQGTDNDCAN